MDHPDLTGLAGKPGNGPFMVLSLREQEGCITAARFQSYGCGPTIASGSMLTEMIIGRTIEECAKPTAEELIEALDGVPPDKLHGPALLRVPGTLDSNLVATRATRRRHVVVRMLRAVVSLAGADLPGERVRTRAGVPGRARVRDPGKREPQQGPTPVGGVASLWTTP
jgi:nitrogen fixation NifU-like protein